MRISDWSSDVCSSDLNLARKSQKTQEIKEIKMRPNIDDHDFDVKMKKVFDFLEEGDKVKMTMRFRGREMSHTQLGLNVLQRVAELTSAIAKVEAHRPEEHTSELQSLMRNPYSVFCLNKNIESNDT